MFTLLQAINIVLENLEQVEIKGRENVQHLYKAQDAAFAVKVALEAQEAKKAEENTETKDDE